MCWKRGGEGLTCACVVQSSDWNSWSTNRRWVGIASGIRSCTEERWECYTTQHNTHTHIFKSLLTRRIRLTDCRFNYGTYAVTPSTCMKTCLYSSTRNIICRHLAYVWLNSLCYKKQYYMLMVNIHKILQEALICLRQLPSGLWLRVWIGHNTA